MPTGAGAVAAPTTLSGPYLTNPRGPTSRAELAIDWNYPIWDKPTFQAPRTGEGVRPTAAVATRERRVLPATEAYSFISQEDRRPLLVLRECLSCNGTDDALLTRECDNERTLLMSRWFNCIKLPADVTSAEHPFHELFAGVEPAHLFVSRWDGSERRELKGDQSRTELWSVLESALNADYEKKVDGALDELFDVLEEFDRIDSEVAAVKDQIDDALESDGADSPKLGKLKKKLDDLVARKDKARVKAERVSAVKLRPKNDGEKRAGEKSV